MSSTANTSDDHESNPLSLTRSITSHVGVDYFDPSGIRRLANEERPSFESEATLAPTDDAFDFEKSIQRIIRKAEQENLKHRALGVSFENLRVTGLGSSASYQDTVASTFNPLQILDKIQTARHPPLRHILEGFEGVVQPGEMLLVLGSPGSGCSTLLKTLANETQEYHKVDGEVHYDALSPKEVEDHYRGDVIYCPEDDVHFPTLSVEDTLKFAAGTREPHNRVSTFGTRDMSTEYMTDVLATIFGLRHALKTVVGDAAIRGVSGGEKKRVSIAEALATRACLTSWDNSTRGLDASTALEYTKALRIATDNFHLTSIVSIYQAAENIYRHFDKVCVIYEGKMAYFGPADKARQYFIDLGYTPANRQTTPDFLTAVTDPLGRIPREDVLTRPKTASEFAQAFLQSHLGKANRSEIQAYKKSHTENPQRASGFIESVHADKAKTARKKSPYVASIPRQVKLVMKRRVQIMRGNMAVTAINLFSFVFQALITGSLFYDVPDSTSGFFSRGGILFFALLFSALTAMSEIPGLYSQRAIIRKHQKAAMYHPFIDALAMTLVDIPITFGILTVFGIILYFMTQLQQSAAQFFVFLLFTFVTSICMKAWFRALAAAFSVEAGATAFAGLSVLIFTNYAGYQIPKPSMIKALSWLTYINPLRYSFESVMSNEFRTVQGSCAALVPQGPGYEDVQLANQVCSTVGSVAGQSFVDGARYLDLSFGFSYSNTWRNFGIVIAFAVGFIAMLLFFTEARSSSFVDVSVVRFKRGSKTDVVNQESSNDPEKAGLGSDRILEKSQKPDGELLASPMTDIFSWQHLDYTITADSGKRKLLDDVSGFVAPGKLTALMGESGAGKTTLLNVLANRVSTGVVSGDRFVNGQGLPRDFQAQTGYCQQMDTHVPTATVREALIFSAKLRQPSSVPESEKVEYAEKCLKMCGLEAYADAIVGSLGVEHRKRTTIGVELAAKPALLLFLDEPTSGLDSQSAWSIVSFLRSLADNGQAILCTIHQPSAELFQSFDRLLLLQKGGKTAYFGDLGKNASTLINYFESNGGRHCEPDENPAEWMLDVIGAGATAVKKVNWAEKWKESEEATVLQQTLQKIHTEGRQRPAVSETLKSTFATPWLYQVKELLQRLTVAYWRDPIYIMAKLFLNVSGGLFIGFTYWNSADSQQGTQNKLFAIFMALIISVPLSNQILVPWVNNRSIYEIRERPSRMYSWTALVTSQILVEIPWNILGSSLLFFCWYWTVGFDSSRAGYSYLMLSVMVPLYYQGFAQAVASMAPNAEIAALVFSLLFSFVLAFNGVMQPYSQLTFWKWMYRLSPYTYVIEGLLGQAIGKQNITCSATELVTLEPPNGQTCGQYMEKFISVAGGYLTNSDATSSCQYCSVSSTDDWLAKSFNIFYSHHWRNVGIIAGFIVFNVFLVFSLTYLFRIRQGGLIPSFLRRRK